MKANNKSLLDEMQERKLLGMEKLAAWTAFSGLFAAIVVQLLFGLGLRAVLGEAAVLFIISAYITVSGLKNGIWTRRVAPTRGNNLIASVIAALLLGIIHMFRVLILGSAPEGAGAAAAQAMCAACVGCFILLEIMRWQYGKKRRQLDEE